MVRSEHMIKHGKLKFLIWAFLLMILLITSIIWMCFMGERKTSREYQGAVFARDLPEGASESPWTQSSSI